MKRIVLISIIVLLIDILTKQIVLHTMTEYQSISMIQNFFSITFTKNTGIAFSFLDGKVPFIIIMTIIVIFFIWKYIKIATLTKIETLCYGFVLGGAIGNLIDRLVYGYVIDFLDFNLFGYACPIFNIADTMIVIGIILLLLVSITESRDLNENYRRRKNKN